MPNPPQIDLKKILQSRTPDSFNSLPQNEYLPTLAAAFLLDRKAQNLTKKTLDFYRMNLQKFIEWWNAQASKELRTCARCGVQFEGALHGRYHSPACKQAAYRERKARKAVMV